MVQAPPGGRAVIESGEAHVRAQAEAAIKLARRARKTFAGKDPTVVGAALGELVALHLAGHIAPDNPEETDRLREVLLETFIRVVRQLIPVLEHSEILPRLEELRQRKRPN
jgi:hypothetical protein